jgi:hypothetical protein
MCIVGLIRLSASIARITTKSRCMAPGQTTVSVRWVAPWLARETRSHLAHLLSQNEETRPDPPQSNKPTLDTRPSP